MTHEELITHLALTKHREGGFFRRTYQSEQLINTDRVASERYLLTSIFYLLTKEHPIGYFHRNQSDIIHYFHQGSPITYFTISPTGLLERFVLGSDLKQDQQLQLMVKGGYWKASVLIEGNYGLLSEAVSPGFDYRDAEMASPASFKIQFPALWEQISHYVAPK